MVKGQGALEVFGLDRPGGGPDEEAMPGAEAQQAKGKVGVCVCMGEEIARGSEGEVNTLRGRGDDESRSQRSDVGIMINGL